MHELATPLGVISMTAHSLLEADLALDEDDRASLVDLADSARRAIDIMKRAQALERTAASPALAPVCVTESPKQNPLVLVADDDKANRRFVSRLLESNQIRVLQAADGEEAWRLIREHQPQLVILDWEMPVYSGLELTDVMKGDPRAASTIVIMLTGRTSVADRAAGERARADLYLTKPVEADELISAVRQALNMT